MKITPKSFSKELSDFVNTATWTYAKTMPEWPHEYIVRGQVDDKLFEQLVCHIRTNGYDGKFYAETYTFYDKEGKTYWTMGAPLEETTVINRCKNENTYERRKWNGGLPG
jgi:hypothetical protein